MILPREFFQCDTVIVAKKLLGKKLVRKIGNKKYTGIITETEAYRASDDPASHAGRRITKRNQIMFGQVGLAYVYFTYGMYHCLNVVAKNKKFDAGAVLIRGIYPIQGIDTMKKNRNNAKNNNLVNGPGKLTQALNISLKENGCDLTKYLSLYITDGIKIKKIHKKPRIGISRGLDKKWNFGIDLLDYF
jgi:DNA-3-methyladenine glycosylase